MAITVKQIKALREKTGAGMMDCKRALIDTNGDESAAIDLLRKKGQKIAAKRARKSALEGLIVSRVSDDGRLGVLVEVNCETDFVARNDEFGSFADIIASLILEQRPVDMEALMALSFDDSRTVSQTLIDLTGKIGEKMGIRRFSLVESQQGRVISYIHQGSSLGVLVELSGASGAVESTGRNIAMQVAAMNPVSATIDEVPEEIRQKEMEIGREAARLDGRPEFILDRIAEGKLIRYYKDNVLLEQAFIKDASMPVKTLLKKNGVVFHKFIRYQLGA